MVWPPHLHQLPPEQLEAPVSPPAAVLRAACAVCCEHSYLQASWPHTKECCPKYWMGRLHGRWGHVLGAAQQRHSSWALEEWSCSVVSLALGTMGQGEQGVAWVRSLSQCRQGMGSFLHNDVFSPHAYWHPRYWQALLLALLHSLHIASLGGTLAHRQAMAGHQVNSAEKSWSCLHSP